MTENLSRKLNEAFAQPVRTDRDYVSPGYSHHDLSHAFPHRVAGDKHNHPWVFLRREVDHGWYVDERNPLMGFLSADEASILTTLGRALPECEALEIGCHRGWSTAHLALGVKQLDVVDPVLSDPAHLADVEGSLKRAGVRRTCALYGATSPAKVVELLKERGRPWSFIFVDGDHEPDGPLWDAQTVANCAARDAIIVFHDLASPVVAEGLAYLRSWGWSCQVFQTMQIMGVAWRGNVKFPVHIPDPQVSWTVPDHLRTFMISGEAPASYAQRLQKFFMDFTSHDPYARARAPVPMGMPTLGALPTDIRKLQDQVRAASGADANAAKYGHALEELTSLLLAERERATELGQRLEGETARTNELTRHLAAEAMPQSEETQRLNSDIARLEAERQTLQSDFASQLAAQRAELEQLRENAANARQQAVEAVAQRESLTRALNEREQTLVDASHELQDYARLNTKLESLSKSRRFLTRRLAARLLKR